MPLFARPPLDTLPPAKDRWTPLYLEHGRLEIDDASLKWIGSDALIVPIPVAALNGILLGPGTSITHAAVKILAQSNCPLFWVGEEGLRFYAYGITPNHDNSMARNHALAWANPRSRNEIARRMFLHRFPNASVHGMTIQQLRGMEGRRVKQIYSQLGTQYGLDWNGRNYKAENWEMSDGLNRAISTANASLYALVSAVCCAMGYIPQLGFVHAAGSLPFIYDIADLYKHETSWPAAFEALSINPNDKGTLVRKVLKQKIEESRMLRRIPEDIKTLFLGLDEPLEDRPLSHPLQPHTDSH